MKNLLKTIFVLIVSFIAGMCLHKCQSPLGNKSIRGSCVTDTITVYDTISYVEPAPVMSRQTGCEQVKIPKGDIKGVINSLPKIRADTALLGSMDTCMEDSDSITIQLSITQNIYEGPNYKAYVSGYEPNLDSIFVFPKTTVIHERSYKPPNKWHIGITGGYGYGFNSKQAEPYIGIGITYSIISF